MMLVMVLCVPVLWKLMMVGDVLWPAVMLYVLCAVGLTVINSD
jgi:hypothetical protein